MKLRHGFISVDDHVQESPDVWAARLSRTQWGDRIPHVEDQPDGTQRWVVDGRPLALPGVASAAALMADRAREPQRWDEVPDMAWHPTARLEAMDADGVDASVLYPTVAGIAGETFARLTDPELELACVQAYNDWLIEEWASASERFIPQCIVPLYPAEATVTEIRRAVGRGHRAVIYPAVPMELRQVPHINDPSYDPIWATCQELEIPLCFHAGASTRAQLAPHSSYSSLRAAALGAMTRPISSVFILVNLLLSGILERYPRLQVIFAESGIAWIPHFLEYADHQFERDRLDREGHELKPSELFRRQCRVTGWYDRATLRIRQFIGTPNILWSTNFPLATGTWPDSRQFVSRWAGDLPPEERDLILWGNVARLYHLEIERSD